MRRAAACLAFLVLCASAGPARAAAPASCGAPNPAKVVTGSFTSDQTGGFVLLPFDVPAGTTAIRAWYCHDQPELPTSQLPAYAIRHTLDFGLYGPRRDRQDPWTMREYRGWSGSGFSRDITISPEGFQTTTPGYRPGPITPGRWAAELGIAAVVPVTQGDVDGTVNWRVELQLETDPAYADEPYVPAPYDDAPARSGPGWFAGDFHVHSSQSGDAKAASPEKVFGHAFGPAGLDFVQVTDHNTDTGWREWGRHQAAYPGRLIARNTETTTYRGHVNAPGLRRLVDYRTGPVFARGEDGALTLLRPARPVSQLLDEVRAAGGAATINHPTIFDASIPPLGVVCRGCSWEYTDAETDFAKVDAIEVMTGPQGLKLPTATGPNPFTPLALDFHARATAAAGRTIAAVSGSDSHKAGDSDAADVTGSPVGEPATMVYANELSERGIADAVRAGHTYVRAFGLRSPELAFTAEAAGLPQAIMGDTVHAPSATFTARVRGRGAGPEPMLLVLLRDGAIRSAVPVTGTDFTHRFEARAPASGAASIGLWLMRGSALEAFVTPIRLTREPAPVAAPLRAALPGRPRLRGRRLTVRCRAEGEDVRGCRVRVRRAGRTIGLRHVRMTAGTARVRVRLARRAARLLRERRRPRVRLLATVTDGAGRRAQARRTAVIRRGRRPGG